MSAAEVENIVDDAVRRLVRAKLEQLGGDPKKVFSDPANHPYLTARDGRKIFIRKARIRKAVGVVSLGTTAAPRFAAPGGNHHMEILAVLDAEGQVTAWEGELVSLYDAALRRRNGTRVVQPDHGPNRKFLFSLAGGEYVAMEMERGDCRLYRVMGVSRGELEFRLHTDARPITVIKKDDPRARVRKSPGALMQVRARKVAVDPLGNVLPAHD